MSVILQRSATAASAVGWQFWAVIPPAASNLDPSLRVPGLGAALEIAFDAVAGDCLKAGKQLGDDPSAVLAHAPACATNASDFAQMLAWTHLADAWAAHPAVTLVICDDPWLFRHLQSRPGVSADAPPPLWPLALRLLIRGWVARLNFAARAAALALLARKPSSRAGNGAPWLLVYAHPRSDAAGEDAYFGDSLRRFPDLRRLLHVDGRLAAIRRLGADGRTFSLHAWGRVWFAFTLPWARWRPRRAFRRGTNGWLVRRAAAREAGTAQAASIRWQLHCQEHWLDEVMPRIVAWPWENHSWERAFVRAATARKVATAGYQHSVVGPQMLNYALGSNPDDTRSIPDVLLCSGESTRERLAAWGMPAERLMTGGALRFVEHGRVQYDPASAVFVALPFDSTVAAEMVSAARRATRDGWRFQVKAHPMTPYIFEDSPGLTATDKPLERHAAVAAVVYAATSVGLEAVLMGLPTLRFRPADRIAIDIAPQGVDIPVTQAETLAGDLRQATAPAPVLRSYIFAPVNRELWQRTLAAPGVPMLPARR